MPTVDANVTVVAMGWAAVLYGIGMGVLFLFGLNLLWLAIVFVIRDTLRPGPVPDPDAVPDLEGPWPAVTVQLPMYNEALVAERLIDACALLRYPQHRLEIQVLDDSTDATVELAERRVEYWRAQGVDILYIHRDDRTGYKAGALQNGLGFAKGDLVAIFDADFIPHPDYLLQVVPAFDSPDIGLVQARWGHQNEDESLLTKIQAFGLNTHFVIEQRARNLLGCFINFNGTAGVWRRECIEDAGGWEADTLTEDLDLSYRAQLKDWRFRFLNDVEVPAELPVDMNAFRAQQFRWTKGAAQTAKKMLPQLWRSKQRLLVKLEGTVHLTAYLVFPFVIVMTLLHAPLIWLKNVGAGPSDLYFAIMGLGLLGFVGFFLAQLFAQRDLYPDWVRRLWLFPLFMAGSMGLSINNTVAIFETLIGKKTAFVRTAKYDLPERRDEGWWKLPYAKAARLPVVLWWELLLFSYSLAGLGVVVYWREWAAVPFQSLFALGFGLVAAFTIQQYVRAVGRRPNT